MGESQELSDGDLELVVGGLSADGKAAANKFVKPKPPAPASAGCGQAVRVASGGIGCQ